MIIQKIRKIKKIDKVQRIKKIWPANICSFDIESTGLKAQFKDSMFSYCVGWPILDEKTGAPIDCKVEVRRLDNDNELENKENWEYLQKLFLDNTVKKVAHNHKMELHFLKRHKIKIASNTIWHDTMIMSQCLNNLRLSHSLLNLCWELFGYTKEIDKEVKKEFDALGSFQLIDKRLMHKYQVADGERPLLLYYLFLPELLKEPKRYNDYLMEIENCQTTQIEESHGLLLDQKNITKLKEWLENELDKIRDESYNLLHEYVNLNSNEVVKRLLFVKYGFPIIAYTKSENPTASTDKDVILELKRKSNHPIFDLILKQRSYTNALSTLESYHKFARGGDILYPNFNQNKKTSRKSSSSPNLQNVSKEAALKNPFPVPMRKCICTPQNSILLPVDYSGIEMRLIIASSGEKELLEMLRKNPDADLHHVTLECFLMPQVYTREGDKIFLEGQRLAKELKAKNKKQYKIARSAYKNTGFCIAYGGSVDKVGVVLMQSVDDILIGDANYRRRFPAINSFTIDTISEVKSNGYITTSFGRKLYVPLDKPYIGSNYKTQGTAAGILKRAQNNVNRFLIKEGLNKYIKMVLDVHDEIIFQYNKCLLHRQKEILPEISRIMIDMPEISVPLSVEWSISTTNWNDKKALNVVY